MSIKNLPLLLVPFILTGCIDLNLNLKFPASLHPFFTEKEITFDQRLLGDWKMGDTNEIARFNKAGNNSYEILLIENGKTAANFESHLLNLDNNLYLDISPAPPDANSGNLQNPLLLPIHMFAKIKLAEPNLQVQFLFIPDALEKDPNFLKHETVDSYIVLTASTKELQDFIKAHSDDKELFSEPAVLERWKPGKTTDSNDTVKIDHKKNDLRLK